MKKKIIYLILAAAIAAISMPVTAYAAGWKKDAAGWWWQNDDGSWPADSWQWLDGNQDGISECYYFNSDGYMLVDTRTPDHYDVNADGAWIVNGAIQTRGQSQGQNRSPGQQILDLVNQERRKAGVGSLSWDEAVAVCADVRAEEITRLFEHERPDGSRFYTVFDEYGVYREALGENIAEGQPTPQAVMEDWMNSPGHKANILNPNFHKLGVGFYQGSEGYQRYWVQLFTS